MILPGHIEEQVPTMKDTSAESPPLVLSLLRLRGTSDLLRYESLAPPTDPEEEEEEEPRLRRFMA